MSGDHNCKILGPLGFFVQGTLGVLAFLVLVLKRHTEKPKRQWKIWAMDTSKQMASMVIAHILNVTLALIISGEHADDPCNWYFITVLLDTTLGMFISIWVLRLIEKIFERNGRQTLKSGNYIKVITPEEQIIDDPIRKQSSEGNSDRIGTSLLRPIIKIDFRVWIIQLTIWVVVVIAAKLVLYCLQIALTAQLRVIANFIFKGLDSNPDTKLVIVMVLIPLFLNALQFWIQDSVLKKHEFSPIEKQYAMSELYELEVELQPMNESHQNKQAPGGNLFSPGPGSNTQPSDNSNNNNHHEYEQDQL